MNKIQEAKSAVDPAGVLRLQEAEFARQVLEVEARAIGDIPLGESFHEAVDLILAATAGSSGREGVAKLGAVVVCGLGKSGIIGQKISATLASTGTPSHFLHATEAMHGDLGRIRRGDVAVLISFGGSTDEVVTLASLLRQDQVPVISIVGRAGSDLARLSSVVVCIGDVTEACPFNLAPTASTTAMLALGDALALSVGRRRNFGVDDFRKNHPGGLLGRQLRPVMEVMRIRAGQNLPVVGSNMTVRQALLQDAQVGQNRRAGALLVVDDTGKLAGIFTDSDLRRLLIKAGEGALDKPIREVMTANPRHLTQNSLVRDAVQLVREFRIDEVPVVDDQGCPLGLLDVQDLVTLKVIEG